MSEEDKKFDRRNFFKEGLKEFFNPIREIIADKISNMPDFSSTFPDEDIFEESFYLRPPGALPEEEFLEKCIRCGSCSKACTFNVISILKRDEIAENDQYTPYSWRPYRETGTPRILPRKEPCRMCEGFPCAAACPAGALEITGDHTAIGHPVIDEYTCLRIEENKECNLCVEACPVGEKAITNNKRNELQVNEDNCTGCGFCEKICPQEPPAIRIFAPG